MNRCRPTSPSILRVENALPGFCSRFLFCAAFLLFALVVGASAQTNGTTAPSDAPGAPAGSYQLSGFENINLYSGNLNFGLPLLKVEGRGEARMTVTLAVNNQRWKSERWVQRAEVGSGGGESCVECRWGNYWIDGSLAINDNGLPFSDTGGTTGGDGVIVTVSPDDWETRRPGYGPGVLMGRQAWNKSAAGSNISGGYTLTRLTFIAPDGTEYELVDEATFGQPKPLNSSAPFNRGAVFVSNDGSAMTFVADAAVQDSAYATRMRPYTVITPAGLLYMADGALYRINDKGLVVWARDRNGNRIDYAYDADGRVSTITDTLNRTVTFTYAAAGIPYDEIGFAGFAAAPRRIRVHRTTLEHAFRTGANYGVRTYADLFSGIDATANATQHNPANIATTVELPDQNLRYELRYNPYGELERVELPTGGAIEYRYGPGHGDIKRRVYERHVYKNKHDASPEGKQIYNATYPSDPFQPRVTTVTASTLDGGGAQLGFSAHSFYGVEGSYSFGFYPSWREGREFQTVEFAADGVTPLRKQVNTWRQRGAVPWYTQPQDNAPSYDPRLVTSLITIEPNGANLVLKRTAIDPRDSTGQTVGFDQFNNQTDSWEYDYGTGSEPQHASRHTHTDFLTTNNGADYTGRAGGHLRRLPRAQQIYTVNTTNGQETLAAQSETRYDEPGFPLLQCGTIESPASCNSVPHWDDPGATPRGNPTTTRKWLNTDGTWPETHVQYDQLGNIRKMWDARDTALTNPTLIDYADLFSDGVSRNTYVFPTRSRSPIPDPGNTGHGTTSRLVTVTAYDFSTGLVVSATDPNDRTTTYDYSDQLNRLKVVTRPDGGVTQYFYGRSLNAGVTNEYVRTLAALDASRSVESYQFFDGLGRPSRSFLNEGGSPPVFTTSDTEYDALGRARRVSNPYRTNGSGAGVNPTERWTTTEYDALGRVTKVTTPDGAKVYTLYDGARTLLTDQAGKQRISKVDALGRLTDVWEVRSQDSATGTEPVSFPIPSNLAPAVPSVSAGYRTSYAYDALGGLRKVEQGGQHRYFMYDSLARLIRARNPEQGTHSRLTYTDAANDAMTANTLWSVAYGYDANGNQTSRIDARNVEATYAYDSLNRNILVSYSDGTPRVKRIYDTAENGLGRYRADWTWDGAGAYYTHRAVDHYDAAGRPLDQRQYVYVNNVAGPAFAISRTYDKAGNVLTQTYPSGHVVAYNYDAAGRLGDNGVQSAFTGNLGDGVQRTYSSALTYDEFGGLRQERFGTQTPLYHKLHYNVRGQLYDVRLSTVPWATDQWEWNRGAVVNYYTGDCQWQVSDAQNNGNLKCSEHAVPLNPNASYTPGAAGAYATSFQTYTYDTLNRLTGVTEKKYTTGGPLTPAFVQAYKYDRWGNRTVDLSQSPNVPVAQYEFERADLQNTNRLYAPGDLNYSNPADPGRKMRYDAAGNLTHDAYTGAGGRAYDGENRMTGAAIDTQGNWAYYAYDADGRRVKRKIFNEEWWQVYGIDNELLAEYRAGAAVYMPSKEYGYRGGELLVTMSSGDDQRLARFVRNLYYGALQVEPQPADLQDKVNQLAAAGAQGKPQLLQKAKEIARGLFVQTAYETSPARTDSQYVTDLYYAYLHRAPDTPGLNNWTAAAAGGVPNRSNVCDAFQESSEFSALVSTLYGHAASDGERRDRIIHVFHLGAYGRIANSTELDSWRGQLDAAAAAGPDEVKAKAELLGRGLFAAQVADLSLPAGQFVTNLYESFLQRGPDAGGLAHWTAQAGTTAQSRQNVLNAFATCPPFREFAGTLYRETFWLVPDHLGTPRMVADRTGSLAGIKRHDYLPFGEDVGANAGGRTTTQGYSRFDGIRQQFTSKEHDSETRLDYFGARYYNRAQGRFTGVDPDNHQARQTPDDPQSWSAYSYVNNNPLRRVDPDGRGWFDNLKQRLENWEYGFRTNAEVQSLENKWRNYLREQEVENGGNLINGCPENCHRVDIDSLSRDEVFRYAADLKYSIENGTLIRYTPEEVGAMPGATTPVIKGTRNKGPSGRVSTEKYLEKNWDKATFGSVKKSIQYHVGKHGKGLSPAEYTQRAIKAFKDPSAVRTKTPDLLGREAVKVVSKEGTGLFTKSGKIIWFHPK